MNFALEELLAETSIGNRRLRKVKYQIEIPERERERDWSELISVRRGKNALILALKEKRYFCRQEKRGCAEQGTALHQRPGSRTKQSRQKGSGRQGAGADGRLVQ